MRNAVQIVHLLKIRPAPHVVIGAPAAPGLHPRTRHRPPAGFSILEVLVVLFLIVLCLTFTFPVLANMHDRYAAGSAASTLSLDLLAVRYRALEENTSYRLRFENDGGYSIEKWTRDGWTERQRRSFDGGVRLESNNHPVFTPSGSVTNLATIYVSCGEYRFRKVTVAITGRVKVERLR